MYGSTPITHSFNQIADPAFNKQIAEALAKDDFGTYKDIIDSGLKGKLPFVNTREIWAPQHVEGNEPALHDFAAKIKKAYPAVHEVELCQEDYGWTLRLYIQPPGLMRSIKTYIRTPDPSRYSTG